MVFVETILNDLVYQTNLYGTQKNKTLRIQREDMLVFLDYWSTSDDLGVKLVSNALSRDMFEKILIHLHCNDNTLLPINNKDKLFKLRPIIDKLNESFKRNYFGTRQVSVDESMVKFKDRSTLKQYNPMKPVKRGYKIWSLADQKGYMLAFKIYQGKEEIVNHEFDKIYGLGERVVLELTKSIWNEQREIYFDNYFSSLPLVQKLKLENTLARGTIRTNRKGLPTEMCTDKKMKRGEHDKKFLSDGISFFKWMDNKAVNFISNFHGSEVTSVNRKEKNGTSVSVTCPTVVSDYNSYMGGVDHADRLRALYDIDRKSRKWWHRLFFGLIDIMFVNSYVVYCTLFEKIPVLEYRRAVVRDNNKEKIQNKNYKNTDNEGATTTTGARKQGPSSSSKPRCYACG
ncbi:piggyBac transposable element-derived protein 3-like [Metopolophium dirhodum]|uniref:piggyBac transposable element-derived protein 3-like n=1 Tax=Metopolophium dirhodum TaxID=44670 RepID=UPI00298FCE63|nr:piggyBac transposable element-derived protein 3-like [Metopolophium dirhodum]